MLRRAPYFMFFLLALPLLLAAQPGRALTNPKASKEARALYAYLNDIYGKKTLSGQMWASWGIDELKYIQDSTGKQPAIRGMDFIHDRENQAEVQHALDWWKTGGIPTIMWHWGAPGLGEGYENSKKPVSIDSCFIKGTPQYAAFWAELKKKGDLLEELQKAHVPVLWRPFHELNGNWFWWGKQGPERFKRLWVTMYNYYVHERKLNNLIWVLCYTGKPITYHECGIPPQPDSCRRDGTVWLWWMEWHTSHLQKLDPAYLRYLYNSEAIVTKDEVPNIVKVYGK